MKEKKYIINKKLLKIENKYINWRIDKFLIEKIPKITRNKIKIAIKNNFILVNKIKKKSNYKVKKNDKISIIIPEKLKNENTNFKNIIINIIYKDKWLFIINKPSGIIVHSFIKNYKITLVDIILNKFKKKLLKNKNKIGIIHRIDKETSGLLVIACEKKIINNLLKQFYEHSIERSYYSVVWGNPKIKLGTIKINISRDKKEKKFVSIFKNNKSKLSITHYKVVKSLKYVSLVKYKLETGKTHQIRIHMRYIDHPILNDSVYKNNNYILDKHLIKRQALHAKSLKFIHPYKKKKTIFENNTPNDFKLLLSKFIEFDNLE